jgi:hypothetical protein
MEYEKLRRIWHEALAQAGLMSMLLQTPLETIDLADLSRSYKINVTLGHRQSEGAFHISASLGWEWNALQATRSRFREEEVLTELMGQQASGLDTIPPWLRIDCTLRGSLPYNAPVLLPDPIRWQQWTAEVADRLEPLLPVDSNMDEHGLKVLSSRSEPEAHLRCHPGGQLFLRRVELSAWQSVELPRNWDNPERPLDPDPENELFNFADRVRQALQVWGQCLPHLHSD